MYVLVPFTNIYLGNRLNFRQDDFAITYHREKLMK